MARVSIAVIGAGLIGREHCALIEAHPDATLTAIADLSETGAGFAKTNGAPYFPDYATMLDEIRPQGAIIALPNVLHAEAGKACLERGIPAFVEKPVADTIENALSMAELSESSGVPILVGHHRRHSPDIRAAKDIVSDGILGDIVAVNGLWLADKPNAYFQDAWRRETGGGPILINLIHEIDCLRYMVGEISEVRAFTSSAARGFNVEDTVSVALRFENGALGTFLLSDSVASPLTWEVTSGQALYFPHRPGDCYTIGGRSGTLAVPSMTVWRHDGSDKAWQDPFLERRMPKSPSKAYRNQLDHFIEVIRGEATPAVTARDAATTLAATLAVDIAAREDRTVAVHELLSNTPVLS